MEKERKAGCFPTCVRGLGPSDRHGCLAARRPSERGQPRPTRAAPSVRQSVCLAITNLRPVCGTGCAVSATKHRVSRPYVTFCDHRGRFTTGAPGNIFSIYIYSESLAMGCRAGLKTAECLGYLGTAPRRCFTSPAPRGHTLYPPSRDYHASNISFGVPIKISLSLDWSPLRMSRLFDNLLLSTSLEVEGRFSRCRSVIITGYKRLLSFDAFDILHSIDGILIMRSKTKQENGNHADRQLGHGPRAATQVVWQLCTLLGYSACLRPAPPLQYQTILTLMHHPSSAAAAPSLFDPVGSCAFLPFAAPGYAEAHSEKLPGSTKSELTDHCKWYGCLELAIHRLDSS